MLLAVCCLCCALPWTWHVSCICDLAPLVGLFAGVKRPGVTQCGLAVIAAHGDKEAVGHQAQRVCIARAWASALHQHPAASRHIGNNDARSIDPLANSACLWPMHDGSADRTAGIYHSCSHCQLPSTDLCQRGLSMSVKSSTCRSSVARPAGPMPPCEQTVALR